RWALRAAVRPTLPAWPPVTASVTASSCGLRSDRSRPALPTGRSASPRQRLQQAADIHCLARVLVAVGHDTDEADRHRRRVWPRPDRAIEVGWLEGGEIALRPLGGRPQIVELHLRARGPERAHLRRRVAVPGVVVVRRAVELLVPAVAHPEIRLAHHLRDL